MIIGPSYSPKVHHQSPLKAPKVALESLLVTHVPTSRSGVEKKVSVDKNGLRHFKFKEYIYICKCRKIWHNSNIYICFVLHGYLKDVCNLEEERTSVFFLICLKKLYTHRDVQVLSHLDPMGFAVCFACVLFIPIGSLYGIFT